jgi:endonuclease YncB( thermonuclease family)
MFRLASLLAMLLVALPAWGEELSGRMRFSDADTLRVGGARVRLFGIDAPEQAQTCTRKDGTPWPCGAWATGRARALFEGRTAHCRRLDTDRYGRAVARCLAGEAGEEVDIAEVLVREGVATAYRRYSRRYVAVEKEAALAGRGIWSGTMESPESFRAARRPPPQTAPGQCLIKGNISRSGRIYHLPGQRDYDQTRIDPTRGERWFCTEAEARAAGWRRAGR